MCTQCDQSLMCVQAGRHLVSSCSARPSRLPFMQHATKQLRSSSNMSPMCTCFATRISSSAWGRFSNGPLGAASRFVTETVTCQWIHRKLLLRRCVVGQEQYKELYAKTQSFWSIVTCLYDAEWIVKVDDDIYIALEKVPALLEQWDRKAVGENPPPTSSVLLVCVTVV